MSWFKSRNQNTSLLSVKRSPKIRVQKLQEIAHNCGVTGYSHVYVLRGRGGKFLIKKPPSEDGFNTCSHFSFYSNQTFRILPHPKCSESAPGYFDSNIIDHLEPASNNEPLSQISEVLRPFKFDFLSGEISEIIRILNYCPPSALNYAWNTTFPSSVFK